MTELDQKTAMYRNGIWKGRDVPFPTALVSGRTRETGHCMAAADYGVMFYPTTVAIDRQGKVLGQLAGQISCDLNADDKTIDADIERLLAQK